MVPTGTRWSTRIGRAAASYEQAHLARASLAAGMPLMHEEGEDSLLARLYRLSVEAEAAYGAEVERGLEGHPAAPWLLAVPGIPRLAAARLLGRLDVRRAASISAFWAYCGLTPDAGRGSSRGFDELARRLVQEIGAALVNEPGAYRDYCQAEYEVLTRSRSDWAESRRRATALRKTEKLFLAHLWLVWREAAGLPLSAPFPSEHPSGSAVVNPWVMVAPDGGTRCSA
jgi:hypothetical protein